MLKFPAMTARREPPLPRMSLRDFACFSERCVKSNPRLVAANCLVQRTDEATIHPPFSLVAAPSEPRSLAAHQGRHSSLDGSGVNA
jgi:hypothetical protein